MGKKIKLPEWIGMAGILEVVNNKKWCWTRNTRCKYISLRIDMRDGKCILLDRNDEVLTLDELKFQYGTDDGIKAIYELNEEQKEKHVEKNRIQ
jgi:hypothetical protein